MTDSFNLVDEPWIPVLYHNGQWRRVGIHTALEEAHHIRQIAASNPMDRLAVLRFLLAVLYWAKGNPPEERNPDPYDSFPVQWFHKLHEHKDFFELLGETKRFYQYLRSKQTSPKTLSINYLAHEVPTGTNLWHFRHSTDKKDGLCSACCAMGLLRLPIFATSGGRGKPPGINSKPPLYAFPLGKSLASSLRLSWQNVAYLGTAAWECPDVQLPGSGEIPVLTGLTWLPRAVWLEDPEQNEQHCIGCGERRQLIYSCVFEGIGSVRTESEGGERIWEDPHVIYAQESKGRRNPLQPSDTLNATNGATSFWVKILEELAAWNKDHTICVIGFSTVQNDKYIEAVEHLFPTPSFRDHIDEVVEYSRQWRKEGDKVQKKLVRIIKMSHNKSDTSQHIEVKSLINAIRPQCEHKAYQHRVDLVSGKETPWHTAANTYRSMMRLVGKTLFPEITSEMFRLQQEISGTILHIRTKDNTSRAQKKKEDQA